MGGILYRDVPRRVLGSLWPGVGDGEGKDEEEKEELFFLQKKARWIVWWDVKSVGGKGGARARGIEEGEWFGKLRKGSLKGGDWGKA